MRKTDENNTRATQTKKRTRIQAANEERILDAALEVFSAYGYRGSTLDQIADKAGMSKPNMLYYFHGKEIIYRTLLFRILDIWLRSLEEIRAHGDPEEEIRNYIEKKIEFSRTNPLESRLFAIEIIQGAKILGPTLNTRLRDLVDEKSLIIKGWVNDGFISPIDPHHLFFMIWSMTQHYADFSSQISLLLDAKNYDDNFFKKAKRNAVDLILGGLKPR